MDPALAALLGVGLGVLGTIGSTFLQTRKAREAWWREHRMQAYADLLVVVERGYRESLDPDDRDELSARGPAESAMLLSLARVELIGPPEVFAHALGWVQATKKSIEHDGMVNGLEEERFRYQQSFVRYSKIALGEPGITGDRRHWLPQWVLRIQENHIMRKVTKGFS